MKGNVSEMLLQEINQQIASEALKIFRRNIEAEEDRVLIVQIRESNLSAMEQVTTYLAFTQKGVRTNPARQVVVVECRYLRAGLGLTLRSFKRIWTQLRNEGKIAMIGKSPMRIALLRPIVPPEARPTLVPAIGERYLR
jgi:hypothetical protein